MTWGKCRAKIASSPSETEGNILSYCDRGECRDHARVGMTEPTSRRSQSAISLARVSEFRDMTFLTPSQRDLCLNLSCESLMLFPLYVPSYCDEGE